MQWAAEFLPKSWIYSSADDDMSFHLPNFARYIDYSIENMLSKTHTEPALQNLPIMCVYCYRDIDELVRNPKSKWYVSKDDYSPEYWPPHCRGGWYSMPVALVEKLYNVSRRASYLAMDDVWITGLMRMKYLGEANIAGISRSAKSLTRLMIEAAPLATRNNTELRTHAHETAAEVIVSHAGGNIRRRNVNVTRTLLKNWRTWYSDFPELKMARGH